MVHASPRAHERLLGRSAQEDRRSPRPRHHQERGRPLLRGQSLLGQALRQAGREEGRPLTPKKRPGLKPELDEAARRLLEEDLEERPAATTLRQRREFLRAVAGLSVSESTVSRALGRLGWSRKKIAGSGRARGVLEGRLAGDGRWRRRRRAACLRRRDGRQRLAL